MSVVAALAASAALVLSACGGSDKGGANAPVDEKAADIQINQQDRANLKEGGELRWAISSYPDNWNRANTNGNNANTATIVDEFLAPKNLLADEAGKLSWNPLYVESAEVEAGPPQVVKLKLNKEAKWNNGDPITWEDYQASWKALNGENEEFKPASTDGWNQIASIEKGADEFEVVATFKESYPDWEAIFSGVYNKNAMATPEIFNEGQKDAPNMDWYAGPFVVAENGLDVAQKMVTLVPNEKWWGEKPLLDKVIFRTIVEPGAEALAFANKEIDVVDGLVTADQVAKVQTRPDGDLRESSGFHWRHFTFNSKSGVLADKDVRKALVKGINREAIAQSDLAGMPIEDISKLMLGNHFFKPGQDGYADNSGDYAYDPEAAGKELDALGWKLEDGQQFRTKDGKTLEFTYTQLAGIPTSENEGKLFQSDMEKIGVKVTMDTQSPDKFNDILDNRSFNVIAFTWVSTIFPMANVGQIYGCDSQSNFTGVCSDKITELTQKIDTEMDRAKRIEYTNEVDKIIWEETMTVPLYLRRHFTAVPKDLANMGAFGTKSMIAENIGWMK
ncbi:MAG: ABC transporter family substrate-binding protein [Actinomycetaceae bacterium]|nr:ABC transporter family substrate-binding protein [Actinomycetaceae bacterium]